MAAAMRTAARPNTMGKFAVKGWLWGLGWLATGLMALASLAMPGTSI
jgi:hypothetical protein